jgi:nitric-oxide synthase
LELSNFLPKEIVYKPGDHLGVFPCNRKYLVDGILKRLNSAFDINIPIELQIQKQIHTSNGL